MKDPNIVLLCRLTKSQLIFKATQLSLTTEGSKLDLAKRIADEESQQFSRMWNKIQGSN